MQGPHKLRPGRFHGLFLIFAGVILLWFSIMMFTTTEWATQLRNKWKSKFAYRLQRTYADDELDNSTCYGVTQDIIDTFDSVYSRTDCSNVQAVVIDRLREIGFGYHFLTLSDASVKLLKRGIIVLFENPTWKYSTPECEQNSIECTFQRITPCQIGDIAKDNACRVARRWGYPEDHWVACFDGDNDRGRLTETHRALPTVRFWIRNLLRLSHGLEAQIAKAKAAAQWPLSGTQVAIHVRQGQKKGPDHVRHGKRQWDANLTATTAAALALKWGANAVLLVSDDHPMTEEVLRLSKTWARADAGSAGLPQIMTTGSFAAGEVGLDCVRENYFRTEECSDEAIVRRQALSAMVDFFLPAIHAQHFAGTMGSEFSMGISYYMKERSPTVDLDKTACVKSERGQKCTLRPWESYRGRCAIPAPGEQCTQLRGMAVTVCV